MVTSTSLAAYRTSIPTTTTSVRDRVLEIIEAAGEEGCISDEILAHFPPHMKTGSVNSRYSELEDDGLVFRAGDTRNGHSGHKQAVWRHIKFAETVPIITGKKKRNPFAEGMKHAVRLALKADPGFRRSPAIYKVFEEVKKLEAKAS